MGKLKLILTILVIAIFFSCTQSPKQDDERGQGQNYQRKDSNGSNQFVADPFWPKKLPNNWILGEVPGVAVDANDHIWIVQRPGSLDERELGATKRPRETECCVPAPSIIEFDPEGNVIQSWGNPDPNQHWITSEHGIFVDEDGHVWISGNNNRDQVVLKYSNDGQLLLQIGEYGQTNGSEDPQLLGGPADIAVDTEANEVYIADGYGNRRIIVYDATSGEYKRHWGAYGKPPHDNELPVDTPGSETLKSFQNPVHAVHLSNDDLVYVADRKNNRIQVFNKDGSFVTEGFVARETIGGSVWDIALSSDSDQSYLFVADGKNMKVWILDRSTLEVIGYFGHGGRNVGQFGWIHNLAMDSKGNLYTGEVRPGMRIQKFKPTSGQGL